MGVVDDKVVTEPLDCEVTAVVVEDTVVLDTVTELVPLEVLLDDAILDGGVVVQLGVLVVVLLGIDV
jgi:hypothetical protein